MLYFSPYGLKGSLVPYDTMGALLRLLFIIEDAALAPDAAAVAPDSTSERSFRGEYFEAVEADESALVASFWAPSATESSMPARSSSPRSTFLHKPLRVEDRFEFDDALCCDSMCPWAAPLLVMD